jgi:hypothetical protein
LKLHKVSCVYFDNVMLSLLISRDASIDHEHQRLICKVLSTFLGHRQVCIVNLMRLFSCFKCMFNDIVILRVSGVIFIHVLKVL